MIYTLTINPAIDKEYTVAHLAYDEVLRASEIRTDPGGKGFNVSRMLAAHGKESTAIGLVGGEPGKMLRESLEKAGIRTDFINIYGKTRTNISIINNTDKHYIKLNEPGAQVSAEEINTLLAKISTLVKPGDYWVLAGSLPPGVPVDIYAKIIQIVQKNGAFAVLDSSGEPLRLGCQAGPFLVKPNAIEASQLTGNPAESVDDLAKVASEIHLMGVRIVVISSGTMGALLSNGNEGWFGHPPAIEEHNPIGAGDAMVAGIVWQIDKGGDFPTALRWGLACGAAAASQHGTGMATLEIIYDLFYKTKIELVKKA